MSDRSRTSLRIQGPATVIILAVAACGTAGSSQPPVESPPPVAHAETPIPPDPFADAALDGKLSPEQADQIMRTVGLRNAAARRAAWTTARSRFSVVDGRGVELGTSSVARIQAGGPIRRLASGGQTLRPPEAVAEVESEGWAMFLPAVEARSTPSCGPSFEVVHFVGTRADGTELVVRMRPDVTSHTLHVTGTCGTGCGQEPQFHLLTGLRVRGAAGAIEVFDVPYPQTMVELACEEMRPLP